MILLLAVGIILALLFARGHRKRDRESERTVRDFLEGHSFPGDTVEEFLETNGDMSLEEVRRLSRAYQAGWRDATEARLRKRTIR